MDEALLSLFAEYRRGVLATVKRDGRPQLSTVVYAWDPERRLIRVSTTADRAKARNLARDPRTCLHVTSDDGWAWTVAEGTAELGEVAADPHDAAVEELIDVYRSVLGEHSDWDEFRAAMVTERRLVVRIPVEHAYGQARRG